MSEKVVSFWAESLDSCKSWAPEDMVYIEMKGAREKQHQWLNLFWTALTLQKGEQFSALGDMLTFFTGAQSKDGTHPSIQFHVQNLNRQLALVMR